MPLFCGFPSSLSTSHLHTLIFVFIVCARAPGIYKYIYIIYTEGEGSLEAHGNMLRATLRKWGSHPFSALCLGVSPLKLHTGISKFLSHFWQFFSRFFYLFSHQVSQNNPTLSILVWDISAPPEPPFV